MPPEMQTTLVLELMSIFAFKVMKQAHQEAIERMKKESDSEDM
jgi:hypothetical protein